MDKVKQNTNALKDLSGKFNLNADQIAALRKEADQTTKDLAADEQLWASKLDLLSGIEQHDVDDMNQEIDSKVQQLKEYTLQQMVLLQKIDQAETEKVKNDPETELSLMKAGMEDEMAEWKAKMAQSELVQSVKLQVSIDKLQGEIDTQKAQVDAELATVTFELNQINSAVTQLESSQRIMFLYGFPAVVSLIGILFFLVIWLFATRKNTRENQRIVLPTSGSYQSARMTWMPNMWPAGSLGHRDNNMVLDDASNESELLMMIENSGGSTTYNSTAGRNPSSKKNVGVPCSLYN